MNIHETFPSKFLKAHDLGDKQPAVVIRTVESQALRVAGGAPVVKLVVHFVGKQKGLVLNKTNATTIATLLGSPETAAWHGQAIRLYATTTTFGAKTVPCVRVKGVSDGGH